MRYLALIALALAVPAHACTAFLENEYTQGTSKVCIYDHLGSVHTINIKSYEVCAVTVRVDH